MNATFHPLALTRVAGALSREVEKGTVPGAVAMIGDRNEVVWRYAVGRQGPQPAAQPMTTQSIFRVFSMTKPIVSVAAMMLVEEGLLLLTDPVSRFIQSFDNVRVAGVDGSTAAPRRRVTVHDLLRHTSGLSHAAFGSEPVRSLYAAAQPVRRDRTAAEVAHALAALPLACHPGEEWIYGASTDVLGRVLEVVAGTSLGALLARRIFEPLGMRETGFFSSQQKSDRFADAFEADPWTGKQQPLFEIAEQPVFESGGGGLVSTADDYALFARMLLCRGALDGTRLISPATLDWMASDHLDAGVRIRSDLMPPGHGFGLGFAVRRVSGSSPFQGSVGQFHWGGLAGTQFWVDAANDVWALLMVQAPGQREYLNTWFRNLVYGALCK